MKYHKFGKLDWKVSALGFGAMRLAVVNNNHGNIDEPEVMRIMPYAFDLGVNYVDSAYGYHIGNTDAVIGKVLKEGCLLNNSHTGCALFPCRGA
jgi:predicted aldo/keto reductase-like oxidoreductase